MRVVSLDDIQNDHPERGISLIEQRVYPYIPGEISNDRGVCVVLEEEDRYFRDTTGFDSVGFHRIYIESNKTNPGFYITHILDDEPFYGTLSSDIFYKVDEFPDHIQVELRMYMGI